MRAIDRWFLGALALGVAGSGAWAVAQRPHEVVLSRFVTTLNGRTRNQAHNAVLAARSINGRWLKPGEVFSFNKAVGAWSSDSGYKRAPVSFDGELVPSWGGGVCQASSTLYNAAMLAGLTPIERHRHRWLAGYVAPGRDAAVAYPSIDLKFRNDHTWPVRLEAEVRANLVEFRVVGPGKLPDRYAIEEQVAGSEDPVTVRHGWKEGLPTRTVRNPGKRGCRVVTYRIRSRGGREAARELLTDDVYPAMNRLLLVDEGN